MMVRASDALAASCCRHASGFTTESSSERATLAPGVSSLDHSLRLITSHERSSASERASASMGSSAQDVSTGSASRSVSGRSPALRQWLGARSPCPTPVACASSSRKATTLSQLINRRRSESSSGAMARRGATGGVLQNRNADVSQLATSMELGQRNSSPRILTRCQSRKI